MNRLFVCTMMSLGLAWPAVAAAAPRPVEPTSPWTLEGSEERCTLLRNFGSGRRLVQLQIESYGSLDRFEVVLIGPLVPRPRTVRPQIRYWFDADPSKRGDFALSSRDNKISYVRFDANFRPSESEPDASAQLLDERLALAAARRPPVPDFERRVGAMVVEFPNRSAVELRLGSMAAPLAALRDCLAKLHKHWGLDAERQAGLSRLPTPNPAAVAFMETQYPATMLARDTSAAMPVRVMVDADGRPSLCVVQLPAAAEAFKQSICAGLNHRFEPALDQAGNPVPAVYTVRVIYLIQ